MADIFISYRRDDSRSATGRLADGLHAAFGSAQIFRDLDSIAPGQDFEAALARAIGGARVLLAVIGPRWTAMADEGGERRLNDPQDFVRRELEAALAAGVPIIPVLVEGAAMPAPSALPSSLASFARCQAVAIRDTGWHDDITRLSTVLQQHHGLEPSLGMHVKNRAGAALLEGLELLSRPRSVIVRLAGAGGRDALGRAALLLLAALVFGNLLFGSALGIGFELITWILSGTLVCLVACGILAGLLGMAWRISGARVGWQRLSIGSACLLGGGWIYLSTGLMCFALGLAFAEPGVFTTFLTRWRSGDMSAWTHVMGPLPEPAMAAIVLSSVVWLGGIVWTAGAWNGLRIAFGARMWQALLAGLVTASVLTGLGLLAAWGAG